MTDSATAILDLSSGRGPAPVGTSADQDANFESGLRRRDEWFEAVYSENASWLMGFALRISGYDQQRAEDVVQETMLRVWRFAPEPRQGDTKFLRPWLATIARHVSINAYRTTLIRPQVQHVEDQTGLSCVSDDTVRILRRMPIAEALRSLSRMHQEILIEMYFHGRTVADAARLLNIAPGTAKSRLHNALRAMRQALLRQGDAGLITG